MSSPLDWGAVRVESPKDWGAIPVAPPDFRQQAIPGSQPAAPEAPITERPGIMARIGRGAEDIYQGATQRALQAEEALNKALGGRLTDKTYDPSTKTYVDVQGPTDPSSADYTAAVNEDL